MYAPYIGTEKSWLYWYEYIYYPTYNRLDGLLVGVSIAGIYTFLPNLWNRISRRGNLSIAFGILLLLYAFFLCKDQQTFVASIFGFPLVAIGSGFVVVGAISPTSYLYRWNSSITTFIATLSYSIYLLHKAVIHTTHRLLESFDLNNNLILIISMVMTLFAAMLLNLLVEKPFLKLRIRIREQP